MVGDQAGECGEKEQGTMKLQVLSENHFGGADQVNCGRSSGPIIKRHDLHRFMHVGAHK